MSFSNQFSSSLVGSMPPCPLHYVNFSLNIYNSFEVINIFVFHMSASYAASHVLEGRSGRSPRLGRQYVNVKTCQSIITAARGRINVHMYVSDSRCRF